ncbi:protein kinase [Streptomyces sp. NPDC048506]|uniref:serine/threonine-protein kinase n=1 Tax=Streptomyces sp. NPDC048506 TaxID=3155028 RepID=UPI00343DCCE6
MLLAGRYRLHAPIGRGAMGEVWRAFDEMLGRPVAVKLLLTHESDLTAASRFRLEAQTAGQLNHPYVVGVLDFGDHEGRPYLVMELVEGDSLARRLDSTGPLAAERVARIVAQAAAGLAAAHHQGIVHRDIKPGNLLLDPDDTLKIGDFGIARFLDDPATALTVAGQIVGTSLYLAPERALGRPASPASDVYSLGCVLYQLLVGDPPFQADTALAILHQHLEAAPVPPRQLGAQMPPAFENYLLSLLAKQPEDRPTAQQAANWFASDAWLGNPEPLPAAAPSPQRQSVPPGQPAPPRPLGQDRAPAAGPSPATTYMLPSATGRTDRARHRPAVRELLSARPKVLGIVAGATAFLAAMLIGMVWFAPDRSSAETPRTDPPPTMRPAPTTPSAPEPSTARTTTRGVDDGYSDAEDKPQREERTKREEERRKGGKGYK